MLVTGTPIGSGGIPVAKAAPWTETDAQVRKRGEQTGLDTLVVHAVNDVNLESVPLSVGSEANAIS